MTARAAPVTIMCIEARTLPWINGSSTSCKTNVIPVAASNAPPTNSRIVRPLEIRAMNMPTNGACHDVDRCSVVA
jgi:hypothetical protein